jgi:hypothetical protein
MLVDFPNYSRANPWQIKTIQTSAPMDVHITNKLQEGDYFALHISWEDILLKGCDTSEKADTIITKFDEFLKKQYVKSKIIWTVHNKTSHTCKLKEHEKKLRNVIMEYASIIILMSEKHSFIIPEAHQSKIVILPHYIEKNRFQNIIKNKTPTFFRYGRNRGRKDNQLYLEIINNSKIKKFISDPNIDYEIDTLETVLTKRRFSFIEADIYSMLSNFSTYYQEPQFNSGVLNFMIGSGLAILHDYDSVRYMDLPKFFDRYCFEIESLKSGNINEIDFHIDLHDSDLRDYISKRSPNIISNMFWKYLLDL